MDYSLDFERPISLLENQIKELKKAPLRANIDLSEEIKALQLKVKKLTSEIYSNLTQWERVQLARHPLRPQTKDYLEGIVTDFEELAGDRKFSDDQSIIGGTGYIAGRRALFIGIEKGKKTKDKITRNFGMPCPEGYRKALRLMKLAERFSLPIITFVDTPGAYPGIDAEERGQAQAIADNLVEMFSIKTPILSVVIGEGGSGGALGLAIADKVYMMEFSTYSVISPESCASILWADPKLAESAAEALKLGPQKALELRVIDEIISEPMGGAHRNHQKAGHHLAEALVKGLDQCYSLPLSDLQSARYKKFREMGNHTILVGDSPV